jgi:acyl-CoA thioester hydrolase
VRLRAACDRGAGPDPEHPSERRNRPAPVWRRGFEITVDGRLVNNVNYFSFFDTAITCYEMTEQVVGLLDGPVHCVVAEVACRYHASLAFPDPVNVGIRVATIGRSSVRYEIGIFRNDETSPRRRDILSMCLSNEGCSGRCRFPSRRGQTAVAGGRFEHDVLQVASIDIECLQFAPTFRCGRRGLAGGEGLGQALEQAVPAGAARDRPI